MLKTAPVLTKQIQWWNPAKGAYEWIRAEEAVEKAKWVDKPKPAFKIGDRVRRSGGGTPLSQDWVGTVSWVTAEHDSVRVKWDQGEEIPYRPHELEPLGTYRAMPVWNDEKDFVPGRRVRTKGLRESGTIISTTPAVLGLLALVKWDKPGTYRLPVSDLTPLPEFDDDWELL